MARRRFDLVTSPLDGTNLIEASAGTGKTYTIAGLFLRLVVEARLGVEQILVVTFTVAATEELRGRIRGRLKEALEAFEGRDPDGDELLRKLLADHDPVRARSDLEHALRELDLAPVFTIHGFCQRVLQEHAFESGAAFDTELVPDLSDLIQETADDFWRTHVAAAPPPVAAAVRRRGLSPGKLASQLQGFLSHPATELRPRVTAGDLRAREEAFARAFGGVARAWPRARGEVERLLLDHQGIQRRRRQYRPEGVAELLAALDRGLAEGAVPSAELFAALEALTPAALAEVARKNRRPPEHPFFDLCGRVLEAEEALLGALVPAFLGQASPALAGKKARANVQGFDDLLTQVHRALTGPGGEALAAALRARYRAALIDEFQDTDPLQYRIFHTVFRAGPLLLIGDPKQAIYGFRGADVFAYLEAARESGRAYTLGLNWRSDPGLVEAVSRVFPEERPFVLPEIHLPPVEAAPRPRREELAVDGAPQAPLRVWFVPREGRPLRSGLITKGWAREHLPRAVAAEVLDLLRLGARGRARIGDRPLEPGDIAVLVRTNRQARWVQEALRDVGVPSVLRSTDTLFASPECREVERVLAALADPGDERRVKAAVSTDMMGVTGPELDRLLDEGRGWERWLERFRGWHERWARGGFLPAFRRLMVEQGVRGRLLRFRDGERRLTNVLHLAEVLHGAEVEGRLGMAGLVRWLAARRGQGGAASEEHQLRLESDERAVGIVTVHRSKGLEYPVVLCPFLWEGSRLDPKEARERGLRYHPEARRAHQVLTFDPEEVAGALPRARVEALAEDVRLLYVALTRAKHRVCLVWGGFNGSPGSAPAYLFHGPLPPEAPDPVAALEERVKGLTDEDLRRGLARITRCPHVAVEEPRWEPEGTYQPPGAEAFEPACRTFGGTVRDEWRVTSFTGLVRGAGEAPVDLPDHDVEVPGATGDGAGPGEGFLGFPRGARTGICLHEILEHLDYAGETDRSPEALVEERLRAHGFGPEWVGPAADAVRRVLATELVPGVPLSALGSRDRLHEVEFTYPVGAAVTPRGLAERLGDPALAALLGGSPDRHLGRLVFAPTRGYLRGFVDLVFRHDGRYHLVDWKTNHLGDRPEDYGPRALARVMAEDLYVLQYHLYALALHLHLRSRLPGYEYDRHFGGVHYVFLRGLDPARPGRGVFQDRPPRERIEALAQYLGLPG